jgi:hypothetical protein
VSSFIPYDDARSLLLGADLVPVENIHWANEPFEEPQSANWLSVESYSNLVDILDLGASKYAEHGTLIVYCCAPAGTGTDSLRTLAKSVCNVFRNLPPRNPYYQMSSIGSGGLSDQGQYYIIPVTVSFIYED